jgi:hypothetical protein
MAVLRTDYVLSRGLTAGGANARHSRSAPYAKRMTRFKACFGPHPFVAARAYALIEPYDEERNFDRYYLMALYKKRMCD